MSNSHNKWISLSSFIDEYPEYQHLLPLVKVRNINYKKNHYLDSYFNRNDFFEVIHLCYTYKSIDYQFNDEQLNKLNAYLMEQIDDCSYDDFITLLEVIIPDFIWL